MDDSSSTKTMVWSTCGEINVRVGLLYLLDKASLYVGKVPRRVFTVALMALEGYFGWWVVE